MDGRLPSIIIIITRILLLVLINHNPDHFFVFVSFRVWCFLQLLIVVSPSHYRMEVSSGKRQCIQTLWLTRVMTDSSFVAPLRYNVRQMEHGAKRQAFVKVYVYKLGSRTIFLFLIYSLFLLDKESNDEHVSFIADCSRTAGGWKCFTSNCTWQSYLKYLNDACMFVVFGRWSIIITGVHASC